MEGMRYLRCENLPAMDLKRVWYDLSPFFSNKYTLTVIIVLAWMTFFDDNSLIRRITAVRELHSLEQAVKEYSTQIEKNRAVIRELESGSQALEKFAREQYLMSRPNEDVYIVED